MSVDNQDITIAQLAVAMNVLPSQLKNEDFNDVVNLMGVFHSRHKAEQKRLNKIQRKTKR